MPERRYGDDEVRRILELATRPEARALQPAAPADGLTLADIQGIAQEVGIDANAVARAAAQLDAPARPAWRTSWGMPIEVGRVVPLPRAPSEREWEQLVAELRATFRASGRLATHGGLREWSNGNLHARVEPTADGYRLRLGTLKGNAAPINAVAAAIVTAGVVVGGAAAISGAAPDAFVRPALLASSGIAAWLGNMLRLPRWARLRYRQMEYIEARMRAIMGDAPDPGRGT